VEHLPAEVDPRLVVDGEHERDLRAQTYRRGRSSPTSLNPFLAQWSTASVNGTCLPAPSVGAQLREFDPPRRQVHDNRVDRHTASPRPTLDAGIMILLL
jgi:hypothetical protein